MIPELKENRTHGTKNYPYDQYYIHNICHAFQVPVHWHEEAEIIFVEKGRLHVKIGEDDFDGEKDDIFFVNSRELHLMSSEDGAVSYYTLLFPLEFISFQTMDDLETMLFAPLRSNRLLFPRRVEDESIKKRVIPILHHMTEVNRFLYERQERAINPAANDMQTRIDLLQMIQILYEADLFTKLEKNEHTNMQKEILAYIQEHYTEKITLAVLAEEFHLSEKYMSHYFVEHFRLPFSNYVVHLRLSYAKQLLETTDEPITEVALQAGFTNVSYFIRAFKTAYGMPPLKYRKSVQ